MRLGEDLLLLAAQGSQRLGLVAAGVAGVGRGPLLAAGHELLHVAAGHQDGQGGADQQGWA
ncbi:hypothetical protein D3C86_2230690 [compost metagenome]